MSSMVWDSQYVAGGHQQITVADTAVNLFTSYLSLIQSTTRSATMIMVTPIDYPLYYTLYGTPATNGDTGHPLAVGDSLEIKGWRNIKSFLMIRQGTSSAKVNITAFFLEMSV